MLGNERAHQGTVRQHRQSLLPGEIQRLSHQLCRQPLPLKGLVDLGVGKSPGLGAGFAVFSEASGLCLDHDGEAVLFRLMNHLRAGLLRVECHKTGVPLSLREGVPLGAVYVSTRSTNAPPGTAVLDDGLAHVRKAHEPTLREASIWSAFYIGVALLFGLVFIFFGDTAHATEYYAGYITEKALSVDNLFVFLVIISSFNVPRKYQQKVLLFGIVFALIARTGFIFLGAGLIHAWSDVFYIFGIILLLTAGQLLKKELSSEEAQEEADNFVVRAARRWLNTSDDYDGDKLTTRINGRRMLTPMLLVMVAIGGTDILFALDSIPAIYGLTQEPYIVFSATAFSLMGLRQLYFLIDGLLERLVYLSYGLAVILGFIGIKLMLHALHENNLWFINNGENVAVLEISTGLSLLVILGVLTVTVLASLVKSRVSGDAETKKPVPAELPERASEQD